MKYSFEWSLLFFSLLFVSCGVVKGNLKNKVVLDNQEESKCQGVKLSEDDQRKFDYFFYEGNRYKAIGDPQKSFMYYSEALAIDTCCAVCNYELSRFLLSSGKYEDAEKLLERAVELSPYNSFYIEMLARVYQNNKNGDKAVEVASKLLNKPAAGPEEIYFVTQLQIENGYYDEAIENLKRLESIMGFNEGLVLEMYQVYLKSEDFKAAEKVLSNLVKKYPGNSDYHLYIGDFYLERGNLEKAFNEYEEVQKVDPENGRVFFSLANYYLQKKDKEQFKQMIFKAFGSGNIEFDDKFQRFVPFLMGMNDANNPLDSAALDKSFSVLIATHPFEPKGYVGYGNFLVAQNDKARAADYFAKALELDAQQSEVWQDYLFLLSGVVDSVEMLEKSREALTFFPENPIFHLFEGVSLYQQQKLEEALSAFNNGLEFVGDNNGLAVQFHAYIGDIYHSFGDTENSFSHYEQALAIDENNLIVLNNYSYYLSLRGERLEEAERMSAKTVELDPGNPTYLDTYAWVLFKRGRYLEAKFIIERAIDEEGEVSGVILEHYGDILFMTGDVNEALKVWGKALEKEDHSDVLLKKIEEKRFIDGEK